MCAAVRARMAREHRGAARIFRWVSNLRGRTLRIVVRERHGSWEQANAPGRVVFSFHVRGSGRDELAARLVAEIIRSESKSVAVVAFSGPMAVARILVRRDTLARADGN